MNALQLLVANRLQNRPVRQSASPSKPLVLTLLLAAILIQNQRQNQPTEQPPTSNASANTIPNTPASTTPSAAVSNYPSPASSNEGTPATPTNTNSPGFTFMQNPTVTDVGGLTQGLNPTQYATRETADQVAQLLGGQVVETRLALMGAPVQYQIQVPGSNNMLNAGLVADLFNRYGTDANSYAWTLINGDLKNG